MPFAFFHQTLFDWLTNPDASDTWYVSVEDGTALVLITLQNAYDGFRNGSKSTWSVEEIRLLESFIGKDISEKKPFIEMYCDSDFVLHCSKILFDHSLYFDAITLLKRYICYSTEQSDNRELLKVYNRLAVTYLNVGDSELALSYYNKGLERCAAVLEQDVDTHATMLFDSGYTYAEIGNDYGIREGLRRTEVALTLLNNRYDSEIYANALYNHGYCLLRARDFARAIDDLQGSVDICRRNGYTKVPYMALNSLGYCYLNSDTPLYKEALKAFDESVMLREQLHAGQAISYLATGYYSIAYACALACKVDHDMNLVKKGLLSVEKAIEIDTIVHGEHHHITCRDMLVKADLLMLTDIASAEEVCKKSAECIQSLLKRRPDYAPLLRHSIYSHSLFAQIHEQTGRHAEAAAEREQEKIAKERLSKSVVVPEF